MSDTDQEEFGAHATTDDHISVDAIRGSLTNLSENFSQQQVCSTDLLEFDDFRLET